MKITTSLSAVLLATCVFFAPMPVQAKTCGMNGEKIREEMMKQKKEVFEKMKQNSQPIRTLSMEFVEDTYESLKPHTMQVFRLKVDIEKNKAFLEQIYVPKNSYDVEMDRMYWITNGIVTHVIKNRIKPKKNTNEPEQISPKGRLLPAKIEAILSYNSIAGLEDDSFMPKMPLFIDGKFSIQKSGFFKVIYADKPEVGIGLGIITSSKINDQEVKYTSLTFSEKTGLLEEKKIYNTGTKNGKDFCTVSLDLNVSDYFLCNGVFFPFRFTFREEDGSRIHVVVNKETARINEPIDEKEFIPRMPTETRNYDELRKLTPFKWKVAAKKPWYSFLMPNTKPTN